MLQFILPALAILLLILPLVKVFQGKASKVSIKRRLTLHVSGFFGIILSVFVFQMIDAPIFAQGDVVDAMTGSIAQGLGFVAAALATGLSALGAGIAVAAATPAAIGAISENEKNFSKSLIFVAMGEGVAIYGLLISILIINAL